MFDKIKEKRGKRLRKFILILALVITTSVLAEEKYAYVDVLKVMNTSKLGEKLRKQLEDKFNAYKKQAQELQKQIETLKQQLKSPLLSEKAKKEKEEKLRDLERQVAQLTVEAQMKLNQLKKQAEQQLLQKIKAITDQYVKEGKADIVFTDRFGGIILYADKTINLTQEILKKLDSEVSKKK